MKKVFTLMVTTLLGLGLVTTGCGTSTQTTGTVKAATQFPTKSITILNSSTAGSPADVMAREVAQYAKTSLGQSMVVENKTGGSGGVMFADLLQQPADGYTIATVTASQIAALQTVLKKNFSMNDFDFLCNIQQEPYAIAVSEDSPFKTLKDMIDYAKKNPGQLKVGGQGTGSAMQLLMMDLADKAGIQITWVPFGGGSESVTNLLGDNVQVISTAPATVNQYVEAGKIRVLAVSGDQRVAQYKDTPTLKEAGYNIVMTQYRGFVAKKGLPADVKAKLVEAIQKATTDPGFKDYMTKNQEPNGWMSPEDFANYAMTDYQNMGKLLAKFVKK